LQQKRSGFTIVAATLQKYLLRADYSVVKEPEIK
jgi:hypothetical protein